MISGDNLVARPIMKDILALTKLNYNTCNFADGLPVTLKFAYLAYIGRIKNA